MLVEQAIFTSAETNRGRGYHLVSRSVGITSETATQLNQWCPSHASLADDEENACSLNFHPLDGNHFAISRTIYGRSEFSQRGGLQVITLILVVRRDQLAGYANNPLALARTTRALGHLRWTGAFPSVLPRIEIADQCCSESLVAATDRTPRLDEVIDLVSREERIAVIAENNSLLFVETLFRLLSLPQRCQLSFTSGLKPSRQRPFQLHILPRVDMQTRSKLSSLHVHCVSVG